MTGFYNLVDALNEELQSSPFVNSVSYGDISDIDLNKQSLYPISHFIVNSFNYKTNVVTFNISLLCMDILDENKEGFSNEQDIFNTQMNVIMRVLALLERGDLYINKYQLDGQPTSEAFTDRFDNKVAGWSVTFDVNVQNEMSIC